MAPLVENPEALNGKFISPEQIGRRAFNSLARAGIGWTPGQHTYLNAEQVANAADTPKQLSERTSQRPSGATGFYGLSEETAEKIANLLKELASGIK